MIALFVLVIGGIYVGAFTATEGAGIGAGGAFLFALARRALTLARAVRGAGGKRPHHLDAVHDPDRRAAVRQFRQLHDHAGRPESFVNLFRRRPVLVVIAICAIYVVLGTAMEELSMILLTVPLFFPVVTALGYDPIWFGIVIVIVVQIGLISPPVGMNIFVVKNLLRHLSIGTVFRGVTPFTVALIVLLAMIVAFPGLATWLPSYMK